mmetsp:Transcript_613/g.1202  ORF Transcript_613/g.1202 Transcript_613/m.1202 type:complete len:263 (+) Transcript_613:222-1010(+)
MLPIVVVIYRSSRWFPLRTKVIPVSMLSLVKFHLLCWWERKIFYGRQVLSQLAQHQFAEETARHCVGLGVFLGFGHVFISNVPAQTAQLLDEGRPIRFRSLSHSHALCAHVKPFEIGRERVTHPSLRNHYDDARHPFQVLKSQLYVTTGIRVSRLRSHPLNPKPLTFSRHILMKGFVKRTFSVLCKHCKGVVQARQISCLHYRLHEGNRELLRRDPYNHHWSNRSLKLPKNLFLLRIPIISVGFCLKKVPNDSFRLLGVVVG